MFQSTQSTVPVLALFSSIFGPAQPDWPARTTITGFPFFDEEASNGLSPELVRFLKSGPPPIVFTLGSAAVLNPGQFYEHGAAAARLLGRRAVLMTGDDPCNVPLNLSDGIVAVPYAPYSKLFPHAAAIVHSGGIGTTAQAMRAGVPMLIVPYAFDQFDNAERARRAGSARILDRHRFTPARAEIEMRNLFADSSYAQRSSHIGAQLRREEGVSAACNVLESQLETNVDDANQSRRG